MADKLLTWECENAAHDECADQHCECACHRQPEAEEVTVTAAEWHRVNSELDRMALVLRDWAEAFAGVHQQGDVGWPFKLFATTCAILGADPLELLKKGLQR